MAPDAPYETEARKKRRRKVLTLYEKMTILSKIGQGRTYSSVARDYNCNESSIRTIKKCEDKIKTSVSMLADPASVKTTCMSRRDTLIEQMEHLLNVWIDEQTAQNVPITSSMIRAQARDIYDSLKSMRPQNVAAPESSFSASKGWFERFRRRANLHNVVVVTEAGTATDDATETYKRSTCWTKVSKVEDSEAQEKANFSTDIETIISLSNMIEKEAFNKPKQLQNAEHSTSAAEEREECKGKEILELQVEVDTKDILRENVKPENKTGVSVNISKILKAAQFLKKKIMQEDPDAERSLRVRREIDVIMQAYSSLREAEQLVDPEVEPINPEVELINSEVEQTDSIQMTIPSMDDYSIT